MRMLPKRGGLILALLVSALGLGAVTAVQAQQAATYPMQVTQNRVPGATGQVTMTSLGNNQVRVDISIKGLPVSPSSRAAHIHTAVGAVCDNNSPITYPLTNVAVDASGNGTSSTTIALTSDKPIQANNAYVNVHEQASPPGQGVICANITQSYLAQGASGAAATTAASGTGTSATTGLPQTGTGGLLDQQGLNGWLLAEIAALALLLGSAGIVGVTRRR